MKKIIKKIIGTTIMIFGFINISFSYSISNFDHTYEIEIYGNENANFYFDKGMEISDIKIKVKQDEDYYYFDVNAVVSIDSTIQNKIISKSTGFGYGSKGSEVKYGLLTLRVGEDGIIQNSINETMSYTKNRLKPFLYNVENFTNYKITRNSSYWVNSAGEYYGMTTSLYACNRQISYFNYQKDIIDHVKKIIYEEVKNNSFYMPHPVENLWQGYKGILYNPNTHQDDIINSNGTETLKNHDGFTLSSNECKIKNIELNGELIKKLDYDVLSTFKINKEVIQKYRYMAFGGLVFITNVTKTFRKQQYEGICLTSNTIDLGNYINCEHNWVYEIDEENNKHIKTCNNCEWKIEREHNFIYEYDGIKENLCECGETKQVNYRYNINDDYIATKSCIYDKGREHENYSYVKKVGYEFKYYNKYKKMIATPSGINYSTTSTTTKVVFIATTSELDIVTDRRSIIYDAIYDKLRFVIHYNTSEGKFSNNSNSMTKYYDYFSIQNLEKIKNLPDKETHHIGYICNGNKIKSVSDIKKLIIGQDMVFYLSADIYKSEYGKSETSSDKREPNGTGGFRDLNDKTNEKINKENIENISFEDEINEIINIDNRKNAYEAKIIEDNEIEVYGMTKTDFEKLCNYLGIDIASISTTRKMIVKREKTNFIETFLKENKVIVIIVFISLFLFILIVYIMKFYKPK